MRFEDVSIVGVARADAPIVVSSAELEAPLRSTMDRLGMPPGMLQGLTGVAARRFWEQGVRPSTAAALAGRRVVDETGIDPAKIGAVISTSVSRDFIEPSNACFVHDALGLSSSCLNFDIGNACLAFVTAVDVISNMIEHKQIEYGLIVDGENSREIVESTVGRLSQSTCDAQTFRDQFASLTLGSGAAAMLLGPTRHAQGEHRYLGSVTRAATAHNLLCYGQPDRGHTDTMGLMNHGLVLAQQTWQEAEHTFGWSASSVDLFALHQVSQAHTQRMAEGVGFGVDKTVLLYPEYGNVGPASIATALSHAVDQQRLNAGDRVVLGGIGSGLNCTAAHVIW